MAVEIKVPDGSVEYEVPVIRLAKFSLEDLFKKRLYLLIPFYIFNYEKSFQMLNEDEGRLAALEAEFLRLRERLRLLMEKGELTPFDYRTLVELSRDVIKELTKNYRKLQERVNGAMVGPIIETEAKRILNKGIAQERVAWEERASSRLIL